MVCIYQTYGRCTDSYFSGWFTHIPRLGSEVRRHDRVSEFFVIVNISLPHAHHMK